MQFQCRSWLIAGLIALTIPGGCNKKETPTAEPAPTPEAIAETPLPAARTPRPEFTPVPTPIDPRTLGMNIPVPLPSESTMSPAAVPTPFLQIGYRWSAKVETAADGQQALVVEGTFRFPTPAYEPELKLAATQPPDALVLDLAFNEQEGNWPLVEAIKNARYEMKPALPAIKGVQVKLPDGRDTYIPIDGQVQ